MWSQQYNETADVSHSWKGIPEDPSEPKWHFPGTRNDEKRRRSESLRFVVRVALTQTDELE